MEKKHKLMTLNDTKIETVTATDNCGNGRQLYGEWGRNRKLSVAVAVGRWCRLSISQTLARGQEISCAEIKERPGQPQPASTSNAASSRNSHTVHAFQEQWVTQNIPFYRIWIKLLKNTPVRKSEDSDSWGFGSTNRSRVHREPVVNLMTITGQLRISSQKRIKRKCANWTLPRQAIHLFQTTENG